MQHTVYDIIMIVILLKITVAIVTIFFRFIGNFIPSEWRKLTGDNGKTLSKTSKQLLSLIVYRLQIYYNKDIEELQENYYFYEESLGLQHRRVRQC
ncbi:hypothetical protein OCHUTO_0647 [Orientia chuto str. Dubai]|uniref:Uncharacterized protein n=1 Tax=Orientia chuto str. Dubai TaxID=1359168 RepID=A0A0F3MJQ5_9RICK|nr:hypothetical protein [Candidatus Orientia mediorientalis]KJV56008.1 hypothetical protein OCHUTO_0647 [Orientia chuto str. Dubai]